MLNRISLNGVANNGCIPKIYYEAREKLFNLDKSIINVRASSVNNAPYSWKRDNCLVLSVGHLLFAYEKNIQKDGTVNIVVYEVAENGQIVNESINKILSLIERIDMIYIN